MVRGEAVNTQRYMTFLTFVASFSTDRSTIRFLFFITHLADKFGVFFIYLYLFQLIIAKVNNPKYTFHHDTDFL